MKRAVLVVFSIILFLIAVPAVFFGILLTAWGSGDSTVQSDPWRTDAPGYAIVSDSVDLEWDSTLSDWFDPTIGVENQDPNQAVFIGIGPTQAVDQYLAGVPQTLIFSIGDDVHANRNVEVPGSAVPQPPAQQDFWLQQASGTGLQELKLDALSGNYRLVAMNADGSAGVAITVQGSLDLPFLLPAGIASIVFGLLLLGLALLLLILGIRAKPKPPAPAGPAGTYPYPEQPTSYAGQAPAPQAPGHAPQAPGQAPPYPGQVPQAPGQAPPYPGQVPQAPPYPGQTPAPYPGQAPPAPPYPGQAAQPPQPPPPPGQAPQPPSPGGTAQPADPRIDEPPAAPAQP